MGVIEDEPKPEPPHQLLYISEIYRELKFRRSKNRDYDSKDDESPMFMLHSKGPLSWDSIESYSSLSGLNLEAWEINLILNIDSIFESARGV